MGKDLMPLIVLPIFSEVNFHVLSSDSLYASRVSWFLETIEYLGQSCEKIYIRRHPDQESYAEVEFVDQLLSHAQGISKSIEVLNDLEMLESVLVYEQGHGRSLVRLCSVTQWPWSSDKLG